MGRVFAATVMALLWSLSALGAEPVRGFYWNLGPAETIGSPALNARTIDLLKVYHVGEVHIWINDNRADSDCAETFYSAPATWWPVDELRSFSRLLQANQIKPIYTISPRIEANPWLNSLLAADGPIALANELGGIPIELDLEGNWQPIKATAKCDALDPGFADESLVVGIKGTSPNSPIIVSTTPDVHGRIRHANLIENVTAVSPQLYGAHFGNSAKSTAATLAKYRAAFKDLPIIPALSIECSSDNARHHRCSQAALEQQLKAIRDALPASQLTSYALWGRREARACPAPSDASVCSTFADGYLRQ